MSEDGPQRRRPNILVTGTPGTGKTGTASLLAVRFIHSFIHPTIAFFCVAELFSFASFDNELLNFLLFNLLLTAGTPWFQARQCG